MFELTNKVQYDLPITIFIMLFFSTFYPWIFFSWYMGISGNYFSKPKWQRGD